MSRFLGWAWLPAFAAFFWAATIVALLILWGATGAPHYKQDEANIVYISDVGAKYKPLFITGACLTSAFFLSSLLVDFILRKSHRLHVHIHPRSTINAICAMLFATIACAALIGLSIFDALNHSTIHWTLTLVFMGCLSVSTIFTAAEFRRLRDDHDGRPALRKSYYAKIFIVLFAIATVIAMIILMSLCRTSNWRETPDAGRCNATHSAAAVCEWVVACLFVVYLLTIVVDLRQSVYTSKRYMSGSDVTAGRRQSSHATLGRRV
ncbi:hypothetical protein HDU90_000114 [Geranomyces variabilis]|nr:hypothetical protein HDU90_000114 [Geranomyces variabilis]